MNLAKLDEKNRGKKYEKLDITFNIKKLNFSIY